MLLVLVDCRLIIFNHLIMKKCDGCNVRKPWEHRCHGKDCDCNNPECMEKQGKITHEQLIELIDKDNENIIRDM